MSTQIPQNCPRVNTLCNCTWGMFIFKKFARTLSLYRVLQLDLWYTSQIPQNILSIKTNISHSQLKFVAFKFEAKWWCLHCGCLLSGGLYFTMTRQQETWNLVFSVDYWDQMIMWSSTYHCLYMCSYRVEWLTINYTFIGPLFILNLLQLLSFRHENMQYLEKLKQLVLFIERKLEKVVTLYFLS